MKIYKLSWLLIAAICIVSCQPTSLVNTPAPPTEVALATATPLPSATALPTPTPTAAETPTVPPTATVEPLATPTSPATASPLPTATQDINWVPYEFENVQLSLPATFQFFDVTSFPLESTTGAISEDCQAQLEQFDEIVASAILIAAMDTLFVNHSVSVFILVEETLPPATTLGMNLERVQACSEVDFVEREVIEINGREVGRIVAESEFLGVSLHQVSYLIQQENWLWTISYTFAPEDAETQLSILQQIVESFTILSE
ncbi:hypothetical protein [Candidatus Leptofilum sp.]|uniref:hypothetical protein n=1 Tax=Candidatus Leptofilum sp. TaxID=3241576 RepID=UPI003B58C91E